MKGTTKEQTNIQPVR